MTGAIVSSEVEVTVSPGVAFKIFTEEPTDAGTPTQRP
jgi:hypothetical protein